MVSREARMLLTESAVIRKEVQPWVTANFWLTAVDVKMAVYVSADIAHIAKSV